MLSVPVSAIMPESADPVVPEKLQAGPVFITLYCPVEYTVTVIPVVGSVIISESAAMTLIAETSSE
jgi:hypothetical protein